MRLVCPTRFVFESHVIDQSHLVPSQYAGRAGSLEYDSYQELCHVSNMGTPRWTQRTAFSTSIPTPCHSSALPKDLFSEVPNDMPDDPSSDVLSDLPTSNALSEVPSNVPSSVPYALSSVPTAANSQSHDAFLEGSTSTGSSLCACLGLVLLL